jgi:hypothetical protein
MTDSGDETRSPRTRRAYRHSSRKLDIGDPPYREDALDLLAFDPNEVT